MVKREYRKFYTTKYFENLQNTTFEKEWKKTYTKLFGLTGNYENEILFEIKGTHTDTFIEYLQSKSNEYSFKKREDGTYCCVKTLKGGYYSPYVLLFVGMYSQLKLFEVAVQNESDLLGLTLDSIILSKKIPIPDGFKEKQKEYKPNHSLEYIHFEEDLPTSFTQITNTPVCRIHYHLGAGGNGKTFETKLKDPTGILVVPTKTLLHKKLKEFKEYYPDQINRVITYCNLMGKNGSEEPYHHSNGTKFEGRFYLDETTMLHTDFIEEIIKTHPNSQLNFMGDIHTNGIPFQCYMKEECKYNPVNVIHYTTDQRSRDPETKQFKLQLREKMKQLFESPNYHEYYQVDSLLPSKFSEFDPKKRILVGSRWLCEYYKSKGYNSINCHQVQGDTLEEEYQIDLSCLSIQKYYTLISRCRSISQISFIEPTDRRDSRWKFRENYFPSKGNVDEYYELENDEEHVYF